MRFPNYDISGTKVLGTVATSICLFDSKGMFKDKAFTLWNYGDGSMSNCVVQASGDGGAWGTIDGTSFGSLGSLVGGVSHYSSPTRYWRAWGAAVAGSMATVTYSVNVGAKYDGSDY